MRIVRPAAWRGGLFVFALVCATAGTAVAQWVSLPLPGVPRNPDKTVNMKAPTPRLSNGKPDLSGMWRVTTNRYNYNLNVPGTEAPMLPWAAELYKQRVASLGAERPGKYCLPHGVPDAITVAGLPFKIRQMPDLTIFLFEEFHMYRQVHSDGRTLPVDPDPAWFGYSVGRWEGDTFVVDTSGYREGSWLDNDGHPHTDAMRTTERYRRPIFGAMEVDVDIDDPKAYSRPWKADTIRLAYEPDTELLEHFCENNRELQRLQQGQAAAPAGR